MKQAKEMLGAESLQTTARQLIIEQKAKAVLVKILKQVILDMGLFLNFIKYHPG